MSLEKKVHSWKIPQGFLKKLKDLTKNLKVSESTSFRGWCFTEYISKYEPLAATLRPDQRS